MDGFRLILMMVLATVIRCDIVIERTNGVQPDRFTLKGSSCTDDSDCSRYGGVKDGGSSQCQCRCTQSHNTFSSIDLTCIRMLDGCEDVLFTANGQIFTFNNVNSQLYPKLPVRHNTSTNTASNLDCETENLNVTYQDINGWAALSSGSVHISDETGSTYIEVDTIAFKELSGRLITVVMNCSAEGSEAKMLCVALKLQGLHTVTLTTGTSESSQIMTLEVNVFLWVVGGCILALVIAGVIGLTIVCTYKRHRRKPGLKVDRVDQNGNIMSNGQMPTQISRTTGITEDGNIRKSPSNGHIRKPLFTKNPNRDQQKTVTIAQTEREVISNRSSPRTPRPTSQNSATFIVNENDPPMMSRSPTDDSPTLKGSIRLKRKQGEEEAIVAAKVALTEFEGARVNPDLQKQNGVVLFNERYQRMSNLHALQAMNTGTSPSHKQKSKRLKRSKLKKKNDEVSGSRLSIDYEHFETSTPDTSQTSSGVSTSKETDEQSANQSSHTDSKADNEQLANTSTVDQVDSGDTDTDCSDAGLREFDVADCFEMEVEEIQPRSAQQDNPDSVITPHRVTQDTNGNKNVTFDQQFPLSETATTDMISGADAISSAEHQGSTSAETSKRSSSEFVVKFDEDPSDFPEGHTEPSPVTYIDDVPITDIDQLILETDSLPQPPPYLLNSTTSNFADVPSEGWSYQPNTGSQWSLASDQVDTRL